MIRPHQDLLSMLGAAASSSSSKNQRTNISQLRLFSMAEVTECCTTHLIDGDGTFNAYGLDKFVKQLKLGNCGLSYVVVAIMGPQSSGKSTLLNHLFHTNFREMDARMGRTQTTKGIWMARCPGIEPCTIVMDIEGTDGQERGEDDTAFEKQSALFAIAVSHIVIINMWCHDIGREHAANKPLLKIVFQVMLKLFSPRKTTLMFVIRDKTMKTPLDILERDLRNDIDKIWDSLPKPEAHKHTPLRTFFNVEVVLLSSYEEKEDQFKEEVASLRKKFFKSIAPGGLAGHRKGVVPGSGFSFSAQQTWKFIKDNKDLDLPSHKIMVETVLCEKFASETYDSFVVNKDWLKLEKDVKSHHVPGFGKRLGSLLDNCLSSYDKEAMYFDGDVRPAKRKELKEKLMQLVQRTYMLMLLHIQSEAKDYFNSAILDALKKGQIPLTQFLEAACDEQQFAEAVHGCTIKSMERFNELWLSDVAYNQAYWDTTPKSDVFLDDLGSNITGLRTLVLSELMKQEAEKKNLTGTLMTLAMWIARIISFLTTGVSM